MHNDLVPIEINEEEEKNWMQIPGQELIPNSEQQQCVCLNSKD